MKKEKGLIGLLLGIIVLFASCGSDDNKSEYSFNGTCSVTIPVKGWENQGTSSSPATYKLDDLLAYYDYEPPVTKGVLYMAETTSIKITGLEEGVVLKDFVLDMNGLIYDKFGSISLENQNTNLYTNETMSYFQNVFNNMVRTKQLTTMVRFTPNVTLAEDSNVNVEIIFYGRFYYKK